MALCEVNPPVNGGFPPQRASNASWCHHETPGRMSCQAQHRSRITTESQISTHAMLVTKGVCRRLLTTGVYASSRLNSFAAGGVYMHRRIGPSLIWDSRLPCHLFEIKIIIFNQKRKLQYNVNPRQPSNIIWILYYIICIANMQKTDFTTNRKPRTSSKMKNFTIDAPSKMQFRRQPLSSTSTRTSSSPMNCWNRGEWYSIEIM